MLKLYPGEDMMRSKSIFIAPMLIRYVLNKKVVIDISYMETHSGRAAIEKWFQSCRIWRCEEIKTLLSFVDMPNQSMEGVKA